MTRTALLLASPALLLAVTSCVTTPAPTAQDAFFGKLTALCGQAFPAALVSNDAADSDLAGKPMMMHVASCTPTQIKIPFHIETKPGEWDRSRTWIITKTKAGLRLKHDHRHKDGTPDEVTLYGGDTADEGFGWRQEFPVDPESIALFNRTGRAVSTTNVWLVEVNNKTYTYQLSRENRLFRVTFDLTKPQPAPPLPWGWEQ